MTTSPTVLRSTILRTRTPDGKLEFRVGFIEPAPHHSDAGFAGFLRQMFAASPVLDSMVAARSTLRERLIALHKQGGCLIERGYSVLDADHLSFPA